MTDKHDKLSDDMKVRVRVAWPRPSWACLLDDGTMYGCDHCDHTFSAFEIDAQGWDGVAHAASCSRHARGPVNGSRRR